MGKGVVWRKEVVGCCRWERRVGESGGWKGGDLLAERGMEGRGTTCLLKE